MGAYSGEKVSQLLYGKFLILSFPGHTRTAFYSSVQMPASCACLGIKLLSNVECDVWLQKVDQPRQ